MSVERVPELVRALYRVVTELEDIFPGRHFTPDGHLIGSLGECLASYHYGLELVAASNKGFDAIADGKPIEIKATASNKVALRSEPEHLLVLRLNRDGGFEEIYNGPGKKVWELFEGKPKPSNGQYQVGLAKLAGLNQEIPEAKRIRRIK